MSFLGILSVVFVFSLMIILHELGHLIMAKRAGIRVREFAVGFGPQLFKRKYKGTIYSLRLFPLGGFNEINLNPSRRAKNSFAVKPLKDRVLVLAAGSFMNLVSAFVAMLFVVLTVGFPQPVQTVRSVESGMLASSFLQPGDKVLSIDGVPVEEMENFGAAYVKNAENFTVGYERNGQRLEKKISKKSGERLGFTYGMEMRKGSFPESVEFSVHAYYIVVSKTFESFHDIATQHEKITESVSGPVGISAAIYRTSNEEGLHGVVLLFSLISISLGIMNLLPIPCLDGGHIVMQFVDAAAKKFFNKKVTEKHLTYVSYVGIAFVCCLMLLGLYADVLRLTR